MVLKHNESQNNTGQMAMVNAMTKLINQSTTSTSFHTYPHLALPSYMLLMMRQEGKPLKPSKIKGWGALCVRVTEDASYRFPLFFKAI
jgi:hypothetical protein